MATKNISKEIRDDLRRKYSSMERHRKGHATQLINSFDRQQGRLSDKQVAFARKIIAEVFHKSDPFLDGETDRRKRPWTKREAEYFERQFKVPQGTKPSAKDSAAYKRFKKSLASLVDIKGRDA